MKDLLRPSLVASRGDRFYAATGPSGSPLPIAQLIAVHLVELG